MGEAGVKGPKTGVKGAATGKKTPGKKVATKAERKDTIVGLVRETLTKKPDIETVDLIKVVLAKFPRSAFGKAHASYYRNMLRRQGVAIPFKRQPDEEKRKKAAERGKKAAA